MANFTKPAIRAAFGKLLEERPLNKITVKDVVERCGVNRNTFYYHYADLPALLEELVRESMGGVVQSFERLDSAGDCLRAVLCYLLENKRAVMHIYNSPNRDMYLQYVRRASRDLVHQHFETILDGSAVPQSDREAVEFAVHCLCIGVVDEWLMGGMKEDTAALAERTADLLTQVTVNVIEQASKGETRG